MDEANAKHAAKTLRPNMMRQNGAEKYVKFRARIWQLMMLRGRSRVLILWPYGQWVVLIYFSRAKAVHNQKDQVVPTSYAAREV
jgi:hypothetical protein